jgi:dTDP-glucose pyrophosphorylase
VSNLESQRDRVFQKFLLEAVDEGLSSLGDSSKKAVYFYLEKVFKIKKQNIPNKINEFTDAIERIFGHGAKVLEIQIMKHLYEKIGEDFEYFPETAELLFSEYVEAARYACVCLETRSRTFQP